MDDERLNQILEETLSLLGNQFPGLIQQLQNPTPLSLNIASSIAFDISNSSFHSSNPSLPLQEEEDGSHDFDISNATTPSNELHLRKYQLLENLSSHWFKHSREYHDIMYQMNSISQQLVQNIINETRYIPHHHYSGLYRTGNQTTRHNPFLFGSGGVDVAGISIPIRRVSVFEQPSPENDTSLYPNIRQIMTATEIYNYSQESTGRTELSCPITLDDFEIGEELCRIRFCRHVFKWKYLQEWFCTNSHCPVCRYDIRTYVPHTGDAAV